MESINIIVEAIDIEIEIEKSFTGSLSTGKLIAHFSSLSTAAECMDNFTTYCHSQRGWKRKVDIGKGKSKVACGWQALATWSSMILLSEVSLWDDTMAVPERNALVKKHWLQFQNTVAKRCFRNASVYNQMASMRCKPSKEVNGQSELPDVTEEPIVTEPIVTEPVVTEPIINPVIVSLQSFSGKLKACKTLKEAQAIIIDLDSLIASLTAGVTIDQAKESEQNN